MQLFKITLLMIAAGAFWTACSDSKTRYVDLGTGQPVTLVKNDTTGLMVDAVTRKPVRLYIDTRTHDTIWGPTGKVVNGSIRLRDNGGYAYIDENGKEVTYTYDSDGGTKVKTDDDGSYKVKSDDEDYKKKVEKDGDIKIKDGDTKIKIDGKTGKKKVKVDD
jgi:YD repeat-containing protein